MQPREGPIHRGEVAGLDVWPTVAVLTIRLPAGPTASAPYSGASGIEEGLQRYGRRDALASYVQFVGSGHRH